MDVIKDKDKLTVNFEYSDEYSDEYSKSTDTTNC